MRLFEFLIHLLQTQAQTLQRLAAFFGEEELLQMLEATGDLPLPEADHFEVESAWFQSPDPQDRSSGYSELQVAVQDLKLPAVLEFHLWAYPFYRLLIESSLDLNSRIRGTGHPAGEILVNAAIEQAKAWTKRLPIRPELSPPAERAAMVPWLRFRTEVLKKIGKRPFASL